MGAKGEPNKTRTENADNESEPAANSLDETTTKFDPIKLENDISEFWKNNEITNKILNSDRGDNYYKFIEGPPTANAPPGVHHVLTRTVKDLFLRYNYMKGYSVPRIGGWDCHGLPVELAVEQRLGIKKKEEIEVYGIEKFISECKKDVFSHIDEWSKMTERAANILDLENPYITMKPEYIESVWWSIKQIWDKNLLYEGDYIVPFCPRCETALSTHEVAQGYKDVEEPSIFIKFKSVDLPNTYFLAWTTTPWTLLSNVALALNPEEYYAEIEYKDQHFILAEARLPALLKEDEYKILNRYQGADLEGKKYEPLFDYAIIEEGKQAYFVINADFVSMDDGTGIVHIAPAFGEDDFNVGKVYDLPMVQPVKPDGTFTEEIVPWKGRFVKDADEEIIEDLRKRGLLEGVHNYKHSYPFCWRCETPLLYYSRKSWFIEMSKLRDNLMRNNEQINWYPDYIKHGRFGDFLDNVRDWALSRERYWGTPLPIWECECGHRLCIGSFSELEKFSGQELKDPHRPYVDEITIPCEKCGKDTRRLPFVIDVWYDSGCAPHASFHYPFESPEIFEARFPNDFISEAIDQTRGWFYSLLAVSTAVFDKPAFLNVICLAHILDKDGFKMSKSRGNIIDPWQIFNNEGADSLRWYFLSIGPPDKPKLFSEEAVKEVQRKFLGTLWNVFSFFTTYAGIDGYTRSTSVSEASSRNTIDLWLLSKLNRLIEVVRDRMDNYDYFTAATEMEDFVIKDLSNWYIRVNRRRFWKTEQDKDKIAGYDTLFEALSELSRLLAPFTPYLTEYFYQKLERTVSSSNAESIHMASLPEFNKELIRTDLEEKLKHIRNIVEAGRSARSSSNLKIRQPLSKVVCVSEIVIDEADLIDIIKTELNVKEVEFKADMEWAKNYKVNLNLKTVGPKFKKDLPELKAHIESAPAPEIKAQLDNTGKYSTSLSGKTIELSADDLKIIDVIPEDYAIGRVAEATVLLDTVITEDLKQEAIAREAVRRIQVMRKDIDLDYSANIDINYNSSEPINEAIEKYSDYIKNETLSTSVTCSDEFKPEKWTEDIGKTIVESDKTSGTALWKLEEGKLLIEIRKK
jgi:isoleucyl-tRNA synthetase